MISKKRCPKVGTIVKLRWLYGDVPAIVIRKDVCIATNSSECRLSRSLWYKTNMTLSTFVRRMNRPAPELGSNVSVPLGKALGYTDLSDKIAKTRRNK